MTMFELGFLTQIILPHAGSYQSRISDIAFRASTIKCIKNEGCDQPHLPTSLKTPLKVDFGVNTDTTELLLRFGSRTKEVATQTPVEFYFNLDFDLNMGTELLDWNLSTVDEVDGFGSTFTTAVIMSQNNPEDPKLVGQQLREIADRFSRNYHKNSHEDVN